MSTDPLISAIVVSYNTREMTVECLAALSAELSPIPNEIWVVDNASADGSADAIRAKFPNAHVIANDRNAGFGAANNQAMQRATGKYLLLINSDAFPKPGAVRALLDYLETHHDVALVGPRLLNRDGSLQRSCFRFPSPVRAWLENLWISRVFSDRSSFGDYRNWPHDRERNVDWVIGACLLVRKCIYEQIGGFDERFFMYSEETDWQRRIRNSNWYIGFTPAAQFTHFGGASGLTEKSLINDHFFHSLDIYERKHHGLHGLLAFRAAMVLGCAIRAIGWAAIALTIAPKRATARAKTRLCSWLVWRQLTCWTDLGAAL